MEITTSQEVKESTSGKELWLSGNIEHLTAGLLGGEIMYTRSPVYNGGDTFQVGVEVWRCGGVEVWKLSFTIFLCGRG